MSGAPLPLFVYGTLLDHDLMARLLERPVRAEPARLPDFEILRLESFPYPLAFHAPGDEVLGRLYRGLRTDDYARLDAYEGVGEGLYQRMEAEVAAEGGAVAAWVYLPTERTLRRLGAL